MSEGHTARAKDRQSLRPMKSQRVQIRAASGRSRHHSARVAGVGAAQAGRAGETWRRGVGRLRCRSRMVERRYVNGSSGRMRAGRRTEGRGRSGGSRERVGQWSAARGRRTGARKEEVRRTGLL